MKRLPAVDVLLKQFIWFGHLCIAVNGCLTFELEYILMTAYIKQFEEKKNGVERWASEEHV